MSYKNLGHGVLSAAVLMLIILSNGCFAMGESAAAELSVTGRLHGMALRSDGIAAAGARVAICSLSLFDCTYVSTDPEGSYAAAGLPPGRYQVALVEGTGSTGTVVREVVAGGDVVADVMPGRSNSDPQTAAPEASKPFVFRFADAYQEDWHPTLPAGPDPVRRGYAGPLDSPPFPGTDFSVGGTPTIGAPDTQSYMLMQAVN